MKRFVEGVDRSHDQNDRNQTTRFTAFLALYRSRYRWRKPPGERLSAHIEFAVTEFKRLETVQKGHSEQRRAHFRLVH